MTDVTVMIPTIGRPESLRACFESLARCEPKAAEILVVDQSDTAETSALVDDFSGIGARRVPSERRGVGHARNVGLVNARYETVLMTDDDCTVDESWVGEGARLAREHPNHLLTGAVLAGPDSPMALSTKEDPTPHDYTGERTYGVLYSNNMVAPRDGVLAFGGFDERLVTAEDNDLSFRWLRAGRPLRYEPSLRVWHNDKRTTEQLRARYVEYWHGQGAFYGKHIRARDRDALRFLVNDLRFYARSQAARLLRRREFPASLQGFLRGLVPGLGHGLVVLSGEGGLSLSEGRDGDAP